MRNWLFTPEQLENTPSRKAGLDRETERRYRKKMVRMILDIGGELKLIPNPTLATASIYFHRFYMFHTFKEFTMELTAIACLFLAGKVEETPKKCRDLVATAKNYLKNNHPRLGRQPVEDVMIIERVLLQTIKFDLRVEHPYQHLLQFAKILDLDKEIARNIVQMAWTLCNDSLSTTLCLQWEPEIIAIGLMHLSRQLVKVEIRNWQNRMPGEENWWDQFVANLSEELLEDICHNVLDLYSTSQKDKQEPLEKTQQKPQQQQQQQQYQQQYQTASPPPPPPPQNRPPLIAPRPAFSSTHRHSSVSSSVFGTVHPYNLRPQHMAQHGMTSYNGPVRLGYRQQIPQQQQQQISQQQNQRGLIQFPPNNR